MEAIYKKQKFELNTETMWQCCASARWASVVMPKQKLFNNAISNCRCANSRGNNERVYYLDNIHFYCAHNVPPLQHKVTTKL